jgi:hypothetical protein
MDIDTVGNGVDEGDDDDDDDDDDNVKRRRGGAGGERGECLRLCLCEQDTDL